MQTPPATPASLLSISIGTKPARRGGATIKLLFIAFLVLVLQIPLHLVNLLQQERRETRKSGNATHVGAQPGNTRETRVEAAGEAEGVFEAYRMVERALKHGVFVLALVFTAFFLFETLAGLRLHAVHYGLMGAAMALFYLALLALGEVIAPALAYVGAAGMSSLLVTLYSAAILKSRERAAVIGALLAGVHAVLYVVLRMENFALLAGTGALFAALAAVMYCTRDIDWHAQDKPAAEVAS